MLRSCRLCRRELGVDKVRGTLWQCQDPAQRTAWRTVPTPPRHRTLASSAVQYRQRGYREEASQRRPDAAEARGRGHRHQYNYDPFSLRPPEDHYGYPLLTARDLASSAQRPRKVRMLASDFIHDSLYNPHYGYFSRQAVLLPSLKEKLDAAGEQTGAIDAGFDFAAMRNELDFMKAVERRYSSFEREVEEQEKQRLGESPVGRFQPKARPSSAEGLEEAQQWGRATAARNAREGVSESDVMAMAARQVWHTPTELFKPHYADAVAHYLLNEYKHGLFPYEDLVVYEIGAGSGTLAEGILAYLEREEPAVFQRTRYHIVEISPRLAEQQQERLQRYHDAGKLQIVQKSILDWDEQVADSCFVIALEVLDNLSHDVVRFHTGTLQPYQALVSIDDTGDMHELWEPAQDPTIARYLALTESAQGHSSLWTPRMKALSWVPDSLRRLFADHFPLYPNLSEPYYLPTSLLKLIDVLRSRFPSHRLVFSDFSALPDAAPGVNGPVVQTRFKGTMIPVSTYRVLQGFFDIFFPTNFEHLRTVYLRSIGEEQAAAAGVEEKNAGSLRSDYFTGGFHRHAGLDERVRILSHADFLEQYGRPEAVRLKDGTNPMLTWYANARWVLS